MSQSDSLWWFVYYFLITPELSADKKSGKTLFTFIETAPEHATLVSPTDQHGISQASFAHSVFLGGGKFIGPLRFTESDIRLDQTTPTTDKRIHRSPQPSPATGPNNIWPTNKRINDTKNRPNGHT